MDRPMPESSAGQPPDSSEGISEAELTRLESEKAGIFEELGRIGPSLSSMDRPLIAMRVLEHSIEDGLDVTEAFSLSRHIILNSLTNREFFLKHENFSHRFKQALDSIKSYASQDERQKIDFFLASMREQVMSAERERLSETKVTWSGGEDTRKKLSETAKPLLDRIEDYYASLLKHRLVRERETPKEKLSRGERLGEQAIEDAHLAREQHCYTSAVLDLLVGLTKTEKKVQPSLMSEVPSEISKVLNLESTGGFISRDGAEMIIRLLGFDSDDIAVKRELKKTEYYPIAQPVRRAEAKKKLRAELVESFKKRGITEDSYELRYDQKTMRFSFMPFEKEGELVKVEGGVTLEQAKVESQYAFPKELLLPELIGPAKLQWVQGASFARYDGKGSDGKGASIVIDWRGLSHFGPFSNVSEQFYENAGRSIFTGQRSDTGDKELYIDGKRWDIKGWTNARIRFRDGEMYVIAQFGEDTRIYEGITLINAISDAWFSHDFEKNGTEISFAVHQRGRVRAGKEDALYIHGDQNSFGPYQDARIFPGNSLAFWAKTADSKNYFYQDGRLEEILPGKDVTEARMEDGQSIFRTRISRANTIVHTYVDRNARPLFDGTEYFKTHEYKNGITVAYTLQGKGWHALYKDKRWLLDAEPMSNLIFATDDDVFFVTSKSVNKLQSRRSGSIEFQGRIVSVDKVDNDVIIAVEEADEIKTYKYPLSSLGTRLTETEERKLDLLNAVELQTPEAIKEYREKHHPEEQKKSAEQKLRDFFSRSKATARTISQMLRKMPQMLLDTMKPTEDNLSDRAMRELALSLFPSAREGLLTEAQRGKQGGSGADKGEAPPGVYVSGDRNQSEFHDGDPRKAGREVLRLRQPVGEMLSTGVYGLTSDKGVTWEQAPMPFSERQVGPTREVTAELVDVIGITTVILPKALHGRVLIDRVKGITEDGQEISLTPEVDSMGQARVKPPEEVVSILYTQSIPELQPVPAEIDADEYKKFRTDVERRFGAESVDAFASLPDDLRLFVSALERRSPTEKLEAIETYVRSIGIYDFDNAEVQDDKAGKSVQEVIQVMRQRANELRKKAGPEKAGLYAGKKYAGVCADFAKLSTALMRAAGLSAGMVMGFKPDADATSVTTKEAHAIAFALWPAEDGRMRPIALDATPGGLTPEEEALLAPMRLPTLAVRRRELVERKDEIELSAEQNIAKLEAMVAHLDEDAIKKLENGELEKVLNAVLGQVRESHLVAVDRLLTASRYAGFDLLAIADSKDLEAEVAMRTFLEKELARERTAGKKNEHFKGGDLLKTLEDFVGRYEKDPGVGSRANALDLLGRLFDMNRNILDPLERRSAAVVITYLRAKKMRASNG